MTQIEVDDLLEKKLGGMLEPLELCDSSGQVVGRYVPDAVYRKKLYDSFVIPYSEEEMERRRSETGGCSLEEIWQRLGQK